MPIMWAGLEEQWPWLSQELKQSTESMESRHLKCFIDCIQKDPHKKNYHGQWLNQNSKSKINFWYNNPKNCRFQSCKEKFYQQVTCIHVWTEEK